MGLELPSEPLRSCLRSLEPDRLGLCVPRWKTPVIDLRGALPRSRLDRLSVGEAVWSRFMSLLGLWAKTPEERGVAAGDWALPLAETPTGD